MDFKIKAVGQPIAVPLVVEMVAEVDSRFAGHDTWEDLERNPLESMRELVLAKLPEAHAKSLVLYGFRRLGPRRIVEHGRPGTHQCLIRAPAAAKDQMMKWSGSTDVCLKEVMRSEADKARRESLIPKAYSQSPAGLVEARELGRMAKRLRDLWGLL
jgi:hypothetical protein